MVANRRDNKLTKCHFIGIGGVGMSALAHILLDKGVEVSGSDRVHSDVIERLKLKGADIFIGHSHHHLQNPSVVVYSTAIQSDHPEVQIATQQNTPFLHRSELLKELMIGSAPLLVTGTHGKTSTSSLLAHLLVNVGLKPSYAIGGFVRSLMSNGGYGTGSCFVAEADESDGSFLKYTPFGAIITNIDNDHLDYWETEAAMGKGFKQFAGSTISKNHLLWNGDDEKLRSLHLEGMSYGFGERNDLKITSYRQIGWKIVFDLFFQHRTYLDIEVPLIGGHNVMNAAAVFGMGLCLNLLESDLRSAFLTFNGIGRRMEKKGSIEGIDLYDDYAHHPTEIHATLRAAKLAVGNRRLIVAFQPHRYTRTRDCMNEFSDAFEGVDQLILTDIYAAGEGAIPGVTTQVLFDKLQEKNNNVFYAKDHELVKCVKQLLQPGDVCLSLGAGDITNLSRQLIQLYEKG